MDVRKGAGAAERYQAGEDDLACINRLATRELTADEVYTFAVRLCDNEVDRDFERFDEAALSALGDLFVGKSGIFDHQWSALGQTARIYRTELVRTLTRATFFLTQTRLSAHAGLRFFLSRRLCGITARNIRFWTLRDTLILPRTQRERFLWRTARRLS